MNTNFKEQPPGNVSRLLVEADESQSAARPDTPNPLCQSQDYLAEKPRGLDPATRLALIVDRLRRETDPETTHCLVLQAEELRHLVREEVRRFARASARRHRTRSRPGESQQAEYAVAPCP